ncbi:DUF3795 domain-containing protein [candidate division WOR-3 bacterium]|nr:DUF3795 domain-containing protein [candidate division WOR-3 bacterium]
MAKKIKVKKMKKDLLAYCGVYCGDCLGHTGVIADAAGEFKKVLEKYEFEKSAKCIFPEQLKDYDKIFDKIVFMASLRCPMICRERTDDNIECEIRKCCKSKGFFACYECDDFKNCEKLKSGMEGLHYEAIIKNLKEIKSMGLEKWIKKGKVHHYWDKED